MSESIIRLKDNSSQKDRVLLRRSKIVELHSQDQSEREILKALGIPRSTIGLDLCVMKRQTFTDITKYQERLPFEHNALMIGINKLLKKAWDAIYLRSHLV